jgi:hypothetical protein
MDLLISPSVHQRMPSRAGSAPTYPEPSASPDAALSNGPEPKRRLRCASASVPLATPCRAEPAGVA